MRHESNWKAVLRATAVAGALAAANPTFADDPADAVPAVVRQLANVYIDAPDSVGVSLDREASVLRFSRGFLMGFSSPGSSFAGAQGIVPAGAAAGAAYAREHPEQLDAIMIGFGYVHRSATGTCISNFEISRFDADDAPVSRFHMKENWWLSGLGTVHSTLPPVPAASRHAGVSSACKVDGYLSPLGRYGHMGTFDRDFKATDIAPADAGAASSAAPQEDRGGAPPGRNVHHSS